MATPRKTLVPETLVPGLVAALVAALFLVTVAASGSGAGGPITPVINELQADPEGSIAGDANGDGVRHFSDDEFVEIVNGAAFDLDLSGWTLADSSGTRHTFPSGSVVVAECSIVVFGGGTPTGGFGGSVVQIASSGALGLNNGGDTVTLNDGVSDVVSVGYGSQGGRSQSLTRDPDIIGAFALHGGATNSGGALFSPGSRIDGSSFRGCTVPTNQTPPTADAGGPYVVGEGGEVSLDASGSSDPEDAAVDLSYEWAFDGDSVFDDATGINPVFPAAGRDGPDTVTVELRVTDSDGLSDATTAAVIVDNVAPVMAEVASSATFDDMADEGEPVTITGSFTDLGTLDTHTVAIAWGDMTTSAAVVTQGAGSGSFEAGHAYAAGGVYSVTVTVTDDDMGEATATTTAVVSGVGLSGGVLQIIGTDGNDHVHVTLVNDEIDVFASFSMPHHRRFAAGDMASVAIWLGGGDDRGNVHPIVDLPTTIRGDHGDDMLSGGSGDDQISGGDGADKLWGRAGDDLLVGGSGNDKLFGGSGANVQID